MVVSDKTISIEKNTEDKKNVIFRVSQRRGGDYKGQKSYKYLTDQRGKPMISHVSLLADDIVLTQFIFL
jgi:hypothetical protein